MQSAANGLRATLQIRGDGFHPLGPQRTFADEPDPGFRGEPHHQLIGNRITDGPAEMERQTGPHAARIELVRGREQRDVGAAGDSFAREHVTEGLIPAERVGELLIGLGDDERRRREGKVRAAHGERHAQQRHARDAGDRDHPPPRHQSICRRMKVGISISLISGLDVGAAGGRLGCTSAGLA